MRKASHAAAAVLAAGAAIVVGRRHTFVMTGGLVHKDTPPAPSPSPSSGGADDGMVR